MDVKCSDCGAVADPLEVCRCGGLPEFVLGDLRLDPIGLRRVVRERRASYEPLFASGVWRWRELLPPIAERRDRLARPKATSRSTIRRRARATPASIASRICTSA